MSSPSSAVTRTRDLVDPRRRCRRRTGRANRRTRRRSATRWPATGSRCPGRRRQGVAGGHGRRERVVGAGPTTGRSRPSRRRRPSSSTVTGAEVTEVRWSNRRPTVTRTLIASPSSPLPEPRQVERGAGLAGDVARADSPLVVVGERVAVVVVAHHGRGQHVPSVSGRRLVDRDRARSERRCRSVTASDVDGGGDAAVPSSACTSTEISSPCPVARDAQVERGTGLTADRLAVAQPLVGVREGVAVVVGGDDRDRKQLVSVPGDVWSIVAELTTGSEFCTVAVSVLEAVGVLVAVPSFAVTVTVISSPRSPKFAVEPGRTCRSWTRHPSVVCCVTPSTFHS